MTSNNSLYFLGAAVVGIVSAAGIFIAEHFRQERRRHVMAQDLARLDQQLSGMRKELEQLRLLQKERFYFQHSNTTTQRGNPLELGPHLTYRAFVRSAQRVRKGKRNPATRALSSMSTASDDYNSALDVDSSDLEFYDLSDDEEPDSISTGTSLDQTLKDLDDKLDSGKIDLIEDALIRLTSLSQRLPENAHLKWRIGKAHHKIYSAANDTAIKQDHLIKGVGVCKEAVTLDPNIAEAHKWFAILIGAQASTAAIKERIGNGCLFKEHLDIAVALCPTDATLHHLLGRYAFEYAGLKWYERKVAETFFGTLPHATFDEALQYGIEAENLTKKDWKENKLLIARCQIAMGHYTDAVESLLKADAMDDEECLDTTVESEIKTLLQKYNSYR